MENIGEVFIEFQNKIIQNLPYLISAFLVFIVFVIAGYIIDYLISRRLRSKWKDVLLAGFVAGVSKWILIIIGVVVGLHMMGFSGIAGSLVAGAGVSAIIVGFAFKDIAENFLAGFLLAINRPFKIRDIIESSGFKGPVQNLDLRVTHIKTSDGKDIYIPNSMIIKNVLINYTKDNILRHEFIVGLDTFDDLVKARDIAMKYFEGHSDILKTPKPNVMIDQIGESSVNVKFLFWVDILKQRSQANSGDTGETIKSQVMREIKDLLLENGFNLPSVIIEHKMYDSKSPLDINISKS
ncbi:MAG: mechanosensitive ion channel [Chitinophagales bacterium]|nr:mechanosensitive ion channel [Chitinophagales bacterium]